LKAVKVREVRKNKEARPNFNVDDLDSDSTYISLSVYISAC